MNELTVVNLGGKLMVDSREVADMVGKRHDHLLRDIQGYIGVLDLNPNLGTANFFVLSSYQDAQNQTRPCFLLTRKGCDMVANKMTGEKGILFTAAYVTKFDEMEKALTDPYKGLSKELQAIFSIDKKTQGLEKRIDRLESDMPLFNVECKELQAAVKRVGIRVLGGHHSSAYKDRSIRGKLYSDIQHQLRREFGVDRYEAIKRSQLDIAMSIVENYKAPMILLNEISASNREAI